MTRITIVSSVVKSELAHIHKPWMAPGALTEIGAMIKIANPKCEIIAWDESVQGEIPLGLIQCSDLLALTFLTPSRYRAIDIARTAQVVGVPFVAGGRDIIGWAREENGLSQIHENFPSVCTTTLNVNLMAEILADAESKNLKANYILPPTESSQLILPKRDLIEPSRYFAGNTLRSSEGCNLNCPWCTVGGRGYYFKEPAVLEEDLNQIHGSFYLDTADSFAGNRDYVIETVLPLYTRTNKHWGTEISVADALGLEVGEPLIGQMARAGCRLLYFGLESVTRRVSADKSSRAIAEIAIKECRRVGIITIGALIIDAFGDETIEETEEMIAWATEWLDFAQFSLVAALPGCTMRKKALRENRIIDQGFENWENYDGAHPTLIHNLSPEVRRQLWRKAYVDFTRLDHVFARSMRAKNILYKLGLLYGGFRYHQGIPKI